MFNSATRLFTVAFHRQEVLGCLLFRVGDVFLQPDVSCQPHRGVEVGAAHLGFGGLLIMIDAPLISVQ